MNKGFKVILFSVLALIVVWFFWVTLIVFNKEYFKNHSILKDNFFVRGPVWASWILLTPLDLTIFDGGIGICLNDAGDELFDVDNHQMYVLPLAKDKQGNLPKETHDWLLMQDRKYTVRWAFHSDENVYLGLVHEGKSYEEMEFGFHRVTPFKWCTISLGAKKIEPAKAFFDSIGS